MVIRPTSAKKRKPGCVMDSKKKEVIDEKSNTVAMFIKLFNNKIIANKRLGFLRKCAMIRNGLLGAFTAALIYDGDREKKATSDPETNAELSKSNNNMNTLTVSSVSKPITKRGISNGQRLEWQVILTCRLACLSWLGGLTRL